MLGFRSKKTQESYDKLLALRKEEDGCPICKEPSEKDFKYWRIVKNPFPYDLIAKDHVMIMPKRHVMEDDLTEEEKEEYRYLEKNYIYQNYNFIMECSEKKRSIKDHYHLHLINEIPDLEDKMRKN
jgi:diadenosine tetraphosphate (Ap4A) HIT family hydrolase